jgi:lysozyme
MAPRGLRGVDVSNHQGSIDWDKVEHAGYRYAIVKTSEGQDYIDPVDLPSTAPDSQRIEHLRARCAQIRQQGMTLGIYHYLRPRPGRTGDVEADWAVKVGREVGWGKPGDIRLAVDVEETALGRIATHRYLSQFVRRALDLTGHKPLIYTFPAFWQGLGNPRNFGCQLWIAHFGVDRPSIPAPWTSYAIWQHSETGSVPGIAGSADLDVAHAALPLIAGEQPLPSPVPHASPGTAREQLIARMRRARRKYLSTGSDAALRVYLISKARLGIWDDRYCLYYGKDPNVEPEVKRYLTRAYAAGLVATSTTGDGHDADSLHYQRGVHGGGRAADAGLRRELIGTAKGLARLQGFQSQEWARRLTLHPTELIGPINDKVVLGGGASPLAEGDPLEDQHDNHVHEAY